MILLLTGIFLGSLVGYLLCRLGEKARIANEKQDLLDFNEQLLREKEELEFRYEHEARSYIRHLDSHCCVFQPVDEEWLEVVG
jgi:hypothetical protein